jgi:hypothetical protein
MKVWLKTHVVLNNGSVENNVRIRVWLKTHVVLNSGSVENNVRIELGFG